jgi:hypothetical protein
MLFKEIIEVYTYNENLTKPIRKKIQSYKSLNQVVYIFTIWL